MVTKLYGLPSQHPTLETPIPLRSIRGFAETKTPMKVRNK